MPLVRYEIGDYAIAADGRCDCGRSLPLIGKIVGRGMNLFRRGESELISPWHLSSAGRSRIVRHADSPVLSGGFESSVDGLHFIGASAVASFGPLLRFIAGAGFAARRIARAVRDRSHSSRGFADSHFDLLAQEAPALVDAERDRP